MQPYPYDQALISFMEIICNDGWAIEVPRHAVNGILDALVMIRRHLKVTEIQQSTSEYIDNKWKFLSVDILKHFINATNCWHIEDILPDHILAMESENENYVKIEEFVFKFNLYNVGIDWNRFIEYLVEHEDINKINTLLHYKPELVESSIKALSSDKNSKYASKIIDNFQLDIHDYPAILK